MMYAATLYAALISEPVRYRRGRVRYPQAVQRKAETPKPPAEPEIKIITPIVNPNTFNERFEALPRIKGDRLNANRPKSN